MHLEGIGKGVIFLFFGFATDNRLYIYRYHHFFISFPQKTSKYSFAFTNPFSSTFLKLLNFNPQLDNTFVFGDPSMKWWFRTILRNKDIFWDLALGRGGQWGLMVNWKSMDTSTIGLLRGELDPGNHWEGGDIVLQNNSIPWRNHLQSTINNFFLSIQSSGHNPSLEWPWLVTLITCLD